MKINQIDQPLSQIEADVLVLGIFQDENIGKAIASMDKKFPNELVEAIESACDIEGFAGKPGQYITVTSLSTVPSSVIALKGLGKKDKYDVTTARKAAANIARRMAARGNRKKVVLALRLPTSTEYVQAITEGWYLGRYTFTEYKTKKEDLPTKAPESLAILTNVAADKFAQAVRTGTVIAEATNFARELIAQPPAVMTPTRLAKAAQDLSDYLVQCQIIDRDKAEKMGMGAFLGVARGAKEPPKFIALHYKPAKSKKCIALVGKGITFDSGGLSLKTPQGMENMKYDMSGAAIVIGVMKAIAELKPNVEVWSIVAATENMPGGAAMHPGDVLTAMNGKTIEVNNTDAEGRLVLADALTFALKQKPDEIVDVATLTGAVVTALGRAAAGIMGNDDEYVERLTKAGAAAGEKFWQLPLFDEYKDALKSDIADLKNAGAKGEAGTAAAAMFLKEFVEKTTWAHLDIAGPAWSDKDKDELNKGGTAFGVRALCYYVLGEAGRS